MDKHETIEQYLAAIPPEEAEALSRLRATIRSVAPDATESISYGIPTFKHGGRPLIYLGTSKKGLAIYGTSAGTMHFPPDGVPDETFLRPLLEARIAEIEAARTRRTRR